MSQGDALEAAGCTGVEAMGHSWCSGVTLGQAGGLDVDGFGSVLGRCNMYQSGRRIREKLAGMYVLWDTSIDKLTMSFHGWALRKLAAHWPCPRYCAFLKEL